MGHAHETGFTDDGDEGNDTDVEKIDENNDSVSNQPWRSGEGRRTYFNKFVSLSGAGSSPASSISRENSTTASVAVVLVVR